MYFVYILSCADGSLYTGITTDVRRRFAEHQRGKGGNYTRANRPREVLYQEEYPNRSLASKREAAIKQLPRKEKLALIASARRRRARGRGLGKASSVV